jgi:hypothetical protein
MVRATDMFAYVYSCELDGRKGAGRGWSDDDRASSVEL